jgi:cell wall-associated NlpC family hydrolase
LARWNAASAEWLGVPYREGGLSKQGIDCSGLVLQVYRTVTGMRLPHSSKQMFQMGIPVSTAQLRAGDLVFFHTSDGRTINHVGIYLKNNQFVHASITKGGMVSSLKEAYFAKSYAGARRVY